MSKLPPGILLIVTIYGVGLGAQRGTDFSGSWVLDEASDRSAAVPQTLIVQQPITTTNRLGAAMPPAYLSITVERHFADRVQTNTYQIGMIGGVVGGLSGGVATGPTTESSVLWDGDSLRFENWVLSTPGKIARGSAEVWKLDDRGRLVIAISTHEGGAVDTRTLAFRKETR